MMPCSPQTGARDGGRLRKRIAGARVWEGVAVQCIRGCAETLAYP